MTDFSTESNYCLQQVHVEDAVCELCHKKCKSESGLKWLKTVRHDMTEDAEKQNEGGQESYLTFVAYLRIVEKTKHKIDDNKIYPKSEMS